ncbi:MAG: hypothetical protein LBN18_03390, partial [Dysgonamonadaceae bacterium]|nr:hypothetical protein [Dysgonamonadaceae bacterium]
MKKTIYFVLGLTLLLAACDSNNDQPGPVQKARLTGHVQKGPFVNGSSVTIIELDQQLNQTGKVYATSIADNSGSFEQKDIDLASHFVQLKADGYYFNEVSGTLSSGQLTLYALADVSDASTVNVNVLTNLERARVEYLVQQESKSFAAAKKQAQKEILDIFGFTLPSNVDSELLDLTQDAILLAISCILQGPSPSTGTMVELMANISADIRPDGKLDDQTLGSKLMNNARNISSTAIRNNLETKYAELGIDVTIPDFESYVQAFLDQDLYPQTLFITYPASGEDGPNILSDAVMSVQANQGSYSMKADVPEGLSLKIVLKGGLWYYRSVPAPLNWRVSVYDEVNQRQEFTVIENGKPTELWFLPDRGAWDAETKASYITIEYYENGVAVPTKVKKLKITDGKEEIVCEFTNPLVDLFWLKDLIEYVESEVEPYIHIAKVYQCIYDSKTATGQI